MITIGEEELAFIFLPTMKSLTFEESLHIKSGFGYKYDWYDNAAKSIKDYLTRTTQKTKSGGSMSRMAHMELAIKHNMNVQLGDVIHYVNNGVRASHGDVQKVNKPKSGWKEEQLDLFNSNNENYKEKEKFLLKNGWEQSWGDDNWVRSDSPNKEANTGIPTEGAYQRAISDIVGSVVQLNCYRIEPSDLENNPEMLGEYNIQRAIATFNKRVEPLLIVFSNEVRDSLLVKNPEDRSFYTSGQCVLTNGNPFKPEDQDDIYENLIKLEQGEVDFWNNVGISPDHIYDLAEPGWEEHI